MCRNLKRGLVEGGGVSMLLMGLRLGRRIYYYVDYEEKNRGALLLQ